MINIYRTRIDQLQHESYAAGRFEGFALGFFFGISFVSLLIYLN